VIWPDANGSPQKEPRNHRGTTERGLQVISGYDRKAENPYGKPIRRAIVNCFSRSWTCHSSPLRWSIPHEDDAAGWCGPAFRELP
jgi:hypothetical protein